MSELGALYRELIAIGTQILQSSDTRAILQEVAQAFVRYSRFERVGVSLYARPVPPDQPDPPLISRSWRRGIPSARPSMSLRSDCPSCARWPSRRRIRAPTGGRMICSIGI
jgi:hypothetical protein